MPSGPGVIPDDWIGIIAAVVPPGVSTFLLTSSREVEEIIGQQHRFGVDVCSGLRTAGALDTIKLARFVRELKAVDHGPDGCAEPRSDQPKKPWANPRRVK